jgi:hypothetical protein
MMMFLFGVIVHRLLITLEPIQHLLRFSLVSLDLILEDLELNAVMMQIIKKFLLDRTDHIGQVFFLDLGSHLIDDHLHVNNFRLHRIDDLHLLVLFFLFIKIFIVLLTHNVRPCHRVQVFQTARSWVMQEFMLTLGALVEGVLRE